MGVRISPRVFRACQVVARPYKLRDRVQFPAGPLSQHSNCQRSEQRRDYFFLRFLLVESGFSSPAAFSSFVAVVRSDRRIHPDRLSPQRSAAILNASLSSALSRKLILTPLPAIYELYIQSTHKTREKHCFSHLTLYVHCEYNSHM